MEDLQLLKDLGSLGFIDNTENFFKRLNEQPNVFVTKDPEDNYFVQFIFTYQDDPTKLKPKYKIWEMTLVYERDTNKFSNDRMVRNARSTVSGDFNPIIKYYTEVLDDFVHGYDVNKEIFELTIEEIPTGPLTKREYFIEFYNYCYYLFMVV
jgi:hypothetical protein